MAPRKRPRPNPADASSSSLPVAMPTTESSSPSQATFQTESSAATEPVMGSPVHQGGREVPPSLPYLHKQVHKTRSWYGSWPRLPKSSASTQLARENILGGTLQPSSTPDFGRFDSRRLETSEMTSEAAQPAPTETEMRDSQQTLSTDEGGKMDIDEPSQQPPTQPEPPVSETPTGAPNHKPGSVAGSSIKEPETPRRPTTSSGWFGGWFGQSPVPDPAAEPLLQTAEPPQDQDAATQADVKEQEAHKAQEEAAKPEPEPQPQVSAPSESASTQLVPSDVAPKPRNTSWFGIWSTGEGSAAVAGAGTQKQPETAEGETSKAKEPADVVMQDAPPIVEPAAAPATTAPPAAEASKVASHPPPAGSTWVFWSSASKKKDSNAGTSDDPSQQAEDGHLAVAGQESATHPEHATSQDIQDSPPPAASKSKSKQKDTAVSAPRPIRTRSNKRLRPQSMDTGTPTPSPPKPSSLKSDKSPLSAVVGKTLPTTDSLAAPEPPSIANSSTKDASGKAGSSKAAAATAAKETPSKGLPPNILLPSFNSTYRMKENPTILEQIAEFILRTKQAPAKHVFRAKDVSKVKNAISIGIHGLYPAKYIGAIIGAPTGTSMRFASLGADAIQRWADRTGCSDCQIEKVCLEGEGRIAERIDNLWKLLLNWIDHLRKADLIIISCHSQGVPVSIMLLAKLIDMGIISEARIGVCAMAGVSLGPFPDYKSGMGMFMGSAAELWEFCNPRSEISQRYGHALKEVLEYGARITFVGSIDDQLVPMESAIHSPANHPYIYRAVFIDGRLHAPDFIAHLIGFALKLRNLGISDHGLIRELSIPLAGSLYSGEGHSRLYFDDQVYDLAVSHALETTSVPKHECQIQQFESLAATNPYTLPWVMRGLLEETFVKTELSAETDELLRQFDAWKPTTKALKDVKYRLEAVRSKL